MKTTKLLLIIAVVTLTVISYGSNHEPIAEVESSPYVEVSEQALELEEWMTAPFESTFSENDMVLENWMLIPFESNYAEEEIILESWMSSPFESNYAEEEVEMENWMTTAWI